MTQGRGWLETDDEGRYGFWCVTPTPYPIPADGPVGDLLAAAGRGPMRAAHLHFMVTAPGYHRLVTHIFVRGDAHQDSDAVFGVKESLVVDFDEQPAGTPPPGRRPGRPVRRRVLDPRPLRHPPRPSRRPDDRLSRWSRRPPRATPAR